MKAETTMDLDKLATELRETGLKAHLVDTVVIPTIRNHIQTGPRVPFWVDLTQIAKDLEDLGVRVTWGFDEETGHNTISGKTNSSEFLVRDTGASWWVGPVTLRTPALDIIRRHCGTA